MKKANLSYRIPVDQWIDDREFEKILRVFDANRFGFDDVALFSGFVHTPLTLDELERRNRVLAVRYPVLREHGFGAGVNLLSTIGHHDENLTHTLFGYTNLTGLDGAVCPGTFCPNDPAYRKEFLVPMFRMLAQAQPDFIWLDDDIRWMGHGTVGRVCFCDNCLAAFNREYNGKFTRETLREAFNRGTPEEKLRWRRRHLAFSGRNMVSLFELAAKTIHAVNPVIEVGAMDAGMRCGDNADYAELSDALRDGADKPVRWRPGGGAYTDRAFDDFLLGKAVLLGCEAAWLPDEVVNIQAEIENFNYQRLRKSRHATAMEACLYNAAGMTGAAWNVLDNSADHLEEFVPLIETLTRVRPFLDRQVAANGRVRPVGVYNGWTPDWSVVYQLKAGDWGDACWTFADNPHTNELFAAGIPPAFRLEDAAMTILNGETASSLSDEMLKRILAGGLYCDVPTLEILHRRGFGALTGFRLGGAVSFDGRERLVEHPFNAGFAGLIRDCRQSFPWGHEDAFELIPLDGKAEILAELVNYQNELLLPCVLGVYENELGGRVAVSGYYALRDLLFRSKSTQMKRLFRYLSAGRLPAWVDSYHRVALWARPEAGTVSLVNASTDPAQDVILKVKTAAKRGRLTTMWMKEFKVAVEPEADGCARIRLPELAPWEVSLLELE